MTYACWPSATHATAISNFTDQTMVNLDLHGSGYCYLDLAQRCPPVSDHHDSSFSSAQRGGATAPAAPPTKRHGRPAPILTARNTSRGGASRVRNSRGGRTWRWGFGVLLHEGVGRWSCSCGRSRRRGRAGGAVGAAAEREMGAEREDRKSTRLNSSH